MATTRNSQSVCSAVSAGERALSAFIVAGLEVGKIADHGQKSSVLVGDRTLIHDQVGNGSRRADAPPAPLHAVA